MLPFNPDLPEESGFDIGHELCAGTSRGEAEVFYEGASDVSGARKRAVRSVEALIGKRDGKAERRAAVSTHEKAMARLCDKAAASSRCATSRKMVRTPRGTAGTCGGRRCPKDPEKRKEFLAWKQHYQSILASSKVSRILSAGG